MKYFAKFYKPELNLNKSKHVKAKKSISFDIVNVTIL